MHLPAARADKSEIAAFSRASSVKKRGLEVEREVITPKKNMGGTKHYRDTGYWHVPHLKKCEWHKRWRNRLHCGHFKTFV
jgi:hypothetical protein